MKKEDLVITASLVTEINHILKSAEKLYNAYWTTFYNRSDKTLFPFGTRSVVDLKGITDSDVLFDSGNSLYGVCGIPMCFFTDSEHLNERVMQYVKDEYARMQEKEI